jgi:N-acetylmuramoyl-L-alanine amidase
MTAAPCTGARLAGTVLATALTASPALCQVADLRIAADGRQVAIPGTAVNGAAAYPVWALDRLGAASRAAAGHVRVVLFGDTLRFTPFSPYFTAGRAVHPLAFPVVPRNGELLIPEQFFIEWLPRRYAGRVEWRGGTLSARAAAPRADAARAAENEDRPGNGRVVILDPGHGGRDAGRIGPGGLREKDLTLRIAQRLRPLLEARGYEVHLTRTTDTLVALADRPRMANDWKRDRPALFLSIHANAAPSSQARGFETFFLAEAETEDERRVAEMENAAIQYEDRPAGGEPELDLILNSLRNEFYVRASSDLAEVVQEGLASFHEGPNRGVKRAPFRVLVGALMPAALVEVGFLSNAAEERLLGSAAFQQSLAHALATAVDRFFLEHRYMSTNEYR